MALPSNLLDSVVINSPVEGNINWDNNDYRLLSIVGLGTAFSIGDKLLSYKRTAFAAGTAQVNTLSYVAPPVFVVGTTYTIVIMANNTNDRRTYSIIPTVTTVATNMALFTTAIQADSGRIVTVTDNGVATQTFTQLVDTGGFTILQYPALVTNTATTAYVAPSGTYAEVVQYDANTLAGGQFTKYDFFVKQDVQVSHSTEWGYKRGHIIVWAEKNAAGFAAFDAEILEILTASDTDADNRPFDRVIVS